MRLPTLLLVDDDPLVLSAFRRLVRQLPVQFVAASSAEEALEMLDRDPPAIFVSDFQMGGMDGLQFLGRIRARFPAARTVLYTATQAVPPADSGIGLLPKPCRREDIARLVESLRPH